MASNEPDKFAEALVWILVLHWRGIDLTKSCLESVQKLTYKNIRTLVVDNGSQANDGETLKKSFPEITVLRLSENFGFAGGCNRGMEFCLEQNADFIWLINNDARVSPNSLSTLAKHAKQNARVGALGASIVESLESVEKQVIGGHGTIDFVQAKTRVSSNAASGAIECDWLHGSNLLLRSLALKDVGLFDERYFLYFEDTELCQRMRLNGWKCLFVPDAEVEHIGNASTQDKRKHWRSYYYIRNRFLFFETYLKGPKRLPALISMLSHVGRHLAVLPFRGENGRDQLRAELLGTRDYFAKRFGKATCLQWCEPESIDPTNSGT